MKIIFLGTNGWYDTKTGNTTCILLDTENLYIILDAGNGLYKIDKHIKEKKQIYLFISHFHLDHIVGLHILNKFSFSQKFCILGPSGIKHVLKTIINEPYTVPFDKLPFMVELREILEGRYNTPFRFQCKELLHSSRCLGYRFEIEQKVIVYCPDTGICDNAIELSKGADLVITECSYLPGQYCKDWPHLNPEEAAGIAAQANSKKLALVHFDAFLYGALADRKKAGKKARKIFKDIIIAEDDLIINL